MCKKRWALMAFVLGFSGTFAHADVVDPIQHGCSASGAMAAVSQTIKVCHVSRSAIADTPQVPHALVAGDSLFAGDTIVCDVAKDLKITFCASHTETPLALKKAERYLVPVITKEPQNTIPALARAARIAKNEHAIPICRKKLGTLAVGEPQNDWWTQNQLESPKGVIQALVSQSGCFDLIERNPDLAALQGERNNPDRKLGELSSSLKGGADYVVIPNISERSSLWPRSVQGALSTRPRTQKFYASLALVDVNSAEQLALEPGQSTSTSPTSHEYLAGELSSKLTAYGVSAYASSEIGQNVLWAYMESYEKLVNDIKSGKVPAPAPEVETGSR